MAKPAKPKSRSIVDREVYSYEATRIRDAKGKLRPSLTNGDAVAAAMMGMTVDQLREVAEANGMGNLGQRAANNGQYRMTIGQALRARVRRGECVTIGKHVIKSLDQHIPVTEAAYRAKR